MWFEYDDENDFLVENVDYDEIRDEVLYLQSVVDHVLGAGSVYLSVIVNDFTDYQCVFMYEESTAILTDSVEDLIRLLMEHFPDVDWSELYE
jgi:hypothetical protein